VSHIDPQKPVELWPRILQREPYEQSLTLFQRPHDAHSPITGLNARKLLDAKRLRGGRPISRGLAQALLTHETEHRLDEWLASLPTRADDAAQGKALAAALEKGIEPLLRPTEPDRTFARTANRAFELRYWKMIAHLAEGRYINKSCADCVLDEPTRAALKH